MFRATCKECGHEFLVPSCDLEIICPKCKSEVAITGICGGNCAND